MPRTIEVRPLMRKIPQGPEGELLIPRWLDSLTGGAAHKEGVIERVTRFNEALEGLVAAQGHYRDISIGDENMSMDAAKALGNVGKAGQVVREARKQLPLWAKIYETLP